MPLLLLFFSIAITTAAQNKQSPSVNLGDPAPPLRVRAWLKGIPVERYQKGQVYVVEFWATWCRPCIAAMPHLSALARAYKDQVTFIGMDVYEGQVKSPKSISQIKAFVDSMGQRMDFAVAAEDSDFMVSGWMDAMGEDGIPQTFVINGEGRLVWTGYPTDVDSVLAKVLNNTWDIQEAVAERNKDQYLAELQSTANEKLNRYKGNAEKGDFGKPDSALLLIQELVEREPRLKYARIMAFHTFSALLKTDLDKAYRYGSEAMRDSSYDGPHYSSLIDVIDYYADKLKLPVEIFELGAEAYQGKIDRLPESPFLFLYYDKMAQWYSRANIKSKAIEAEQKAIDLLKSNKAFSTKNLAAYQSRLQQYRNK